MKKTKKIWSMLTALSITGAILPASVLAGSDPDLWPDAPLGIFHGVNNKDGYTEGTHYAIGSSSEIVKEGKYSLHINNIAEVENRNINTKIPFTKTLSSGDTYKVSYWIYCTENRWGNIFVGDSSGTTKIYDRVGEKIFNEWQYVEVETTLDRNATNIQFQTWTKQYYIDDLQVCKKNADGTYGENVVLNGDFETLKIYDKNTHMPAQWQGALGNSGSTKGTANGATMITQNTYIASTDDDAYSGDRSMLINCHQELDDAWYRVWTHMEKGLTSGTKYKIGFYLKYLEPGLTNGFYVCNSGGDIMYWNANTSTAVMTKQGVDVGNGWKYYEGTITGNDAQDPTIGLRTWRQRSMLLDDFTLYELDSNGNVVGENLITNSSFEDYLDFESVDPAEYKNNNWTLTPVGLGNDVVRTDYMRFEEVKPGDYALHLNYDDYQKADTYVSATTNHPFSINAGTTYTVEFDMKASGAVDNSVAFHPLGDWKNGPKHKLSSINRDAVERTDLEDGWRHYKYTITADTTVESSMPLKSDSRGDVLIDNIKVYAADGINLVTDGDFSATQKINRTDFENVIAYPAKAGGKIVVSWTNANGTIENTKVMLNGTEQTVEVNNESDAFNEIVLAGTPGEEYTVKVSATINGADKEYTVSAIPTEVKDLASLEEMDFKANGIGDWYSASWASYIRDGEGYANTNISVVTENDNRVVNIKGNIPEVKGNTYAGIEQTVTLEREKLYHLYFKAKGENVTTFKAIEDVALKSGTEFWIEHKKSLSDDWTSYEIELDYTHPTTGESLYDFEASDVYDARLLLVTDNYAGNIWIDDVEVYEIDPDTGDKIGDNLIVNGGFDATPAVYNDPVVTGTFARGNTVNVAVTLENAGEVALITALYKNSQLVNVSWMEKIVGEFPETYDTNITVPDEDGVFTAKVMYWDSIEGMTPYRSAFDIN